MTYSRMAQRAAGVACFLAPAAWLTATLFQVAGSNPGSGIANYYFGLLLMPAFYALTFVVGKQTPRLALVCAVMGTLGIPVIITSGYIELATSIVSQQTGTHMGWDFFLNQAGDMLWILLIVGLPITLFFLSQIILGGSILRTGVLPRYVGALLIAYAILNFVHTAGPVKSGIALLPGILSAVCLLAAYSVLGIHLWRGDAAHGSQTAM